MFLRSTASLLGGVLALLLVVQGSSCGKSRSQQSSTVGDANPASQAEMSSPQNTQKSQDLPAGIWGGDHISMEVTARGATFEFDCAHGSLDQKIVLDSEGKFSMRGKFVRERGGPLVQGDEQKAEDAIYSGSARGEVLNLTITFAASNEAIGTYTLSFGQVGRIRKCK